MDFLIILLRLTPIWMIAGLILMLITGHKKKSLALNKKLLIFSVFMLMTILSIRFIVSAYQEYYAQDDMLGTIGEETVNRDEQEHKKGNIELLSSSFIYSLQSFSTDADYQELLDGITDFYTDYAVDHHTTLATDHGLNNEMVFFLIFMSLINIAAPISGGAIILDVLIIFIPRLKLAFLPSFRRKYYFSALNERTITLAKSIAEKDTVWYHLKPVFIFSDFSDDDDQSSASRLMAEALSLGSICVKSDIISTIKKSKNNCIFLMNDDESENLNLLVSLTEDSNCAKLMGADVYIFCEKSYTGGVAAEVNRKLEKYFENNMQNKPIIISVKSCQNMISNLYNDVPLFEPFLTEKPVPKEERKRLVLTIMGSGSIGTQAFLTATWCAQMTGIDLFINVISSESEEEFNSRIDRVNPDILPTGKKDDEILKIFEDLPGKQSICSDPYFTLEYFSVDLDSVNADTVLNMKNKSGIAIAETDYFIVALGSDEKNIEYSDRLRISIEREMLSTYHQNKDKTYKKKIIAYAVFDSQIAESLNQKNANDTQSTDRVKPCMYAFGDMKHLYSTENVFMSLFEDNAKIVSEEYNLRHSDADGKSSQEIRGLHTKSDFVKRLSKAFVDEYSYQASNARAVHQPYKAFSAGIKIDPVFNSNCALNIAYDKNKISDSFYETLVNFSKKATPDQKEDNGSEFCWRTVSELTWLEHRRWNAFMRTQGFRHSTTVQHDTFHSFTQKDKDLSSKLHNCLVECRTDILTKELKKKYCQNLRKWYSKAPETDQTVEKEEFHYIPGVDDLLDKEGFLVKTDYKIYDMPCVVKKFNS